MLRPTLVFWLGAVVGIVAFLITVETRDLTGVTPLFFLLQGLGVGVSGQGLLFLPLVWEPLLLILLVLLLNRLRRIVT